MFKVISFLILAIAQAITPTGYELGIFREDNSITASIDIPSDTITCRLTDTPIIAPPPPIALTDKNKLIWGGTTPQTPECTAVVDLRNIPGAYYGKMLGKGPDANGVIVKGEWSEKSNYFYVAGTPPPQPQPFTSTCPIVAPLSIMWPETSAQILYPSPNTNGGFSPVITSCTPASGSTFPIGNNTVSCISTDGMARQSSCTIAISVIQLPQPPPSDTTAPAVSVNVKRSGNSSNYVVTAKTSDNVGVVYVKILLDGLQKFYQANPPGTIQYTLKIENRGSHGIRVEASDAVNNIGAAGETVVR